MTVRKATIDDSATIASFNIRMAHETENMTLPQDIISKGVVNLMNNPERGFYIVAEIDTLTVGSLMITTEWSDWRNGFFWWVQSVYVLPEYRRHGIYRAMYDFIKQLANENNDICGFRLYVEEHNLIAKSTYESLGMTKTYYHLYEELK